MDRSISPKPPILRRQNARSPDVHVYYERDDEDQQLEAILNQGRTGDVVMYFANNQEGYREFRIILNQNPGAPPGSKTLQEYPQPELDYNYRMSSKPSNSITNNQKLEDVLKNNSKVVIAFTADWCKYCVQIKKPGGFIDKLNKNGYNVKVFENVDKHESITSKYKIKGFPTIIKFIDGKSVDNYIGPRDCNAESLKKFKEFYNKSGYSYFFENVNYSYMFSRKKKSNCVVSGCQLCQNVAVFSQDFIKKVIPYLRKDDEISGELKIKDKDSRSINYIEGEDVKDPNRCKNGQCNNIYLISSQKVKDGDGETATMIDNRAGYHSHPEDAYINHNCSLGWPSKSDYLTFLETWLGYNAVLHIVVTLEGFYIMTVPAKTVKKLESLSDQDANDLLLEGVKKELNIDKNGYNMIDGCVKNGHTIKTPKDYQKFINNTKLSNKKYIPKELRGCQVFRIDFISYKDLGVKTFKDPESKLEVYRNYGCPYNPKTGEVEFYTNDFSRGIRFTYPSINSQKDPCTLKDL